LQLKLISYRVLQPCGQSRVLFVAVTVCVSVCLSTQQLRDYWSTW